MGKKGAQVIGYRYYLGIHMALCHGPIDAFLGINVGKKVAWEGNVTSSSTITINNPDLFGGDKKEGGVVGDVDLDFGESTQGKNAYLVSIFGDVIPAFRGVTAAIAKKCYVTGMNPYPKPWAFLLKRVAAKNWQTAYSNINNGSANPIHIVYEALTSLEWGMGYPSISIDNASFSAAAITCFNEGLGLSMTLSSQETIEAFIQIVLSHANGVLYTRTDTGAFAIKLLREDYVIGSLKHFDESNVVDMESFERPSPAEMVNEVVVVYRPRGTAADDSVVVQALASIQAQNGVISQTKQYPGIDNAANASRVALRDLKQMSTPLARVSLKVNRYGWNLVVGDVISFSWVNLGISQIALRILKINFGDTSTGTISIDAAEDVFGLPSSTYVAPTTRLWVDVPDIATVAVSRKVFEAPYWDVMRSMTEADSAYLTSSSAFLMAVAGKPSTVETSYDLYTRTGSAAYRLAASKSFCPFAASLLGLSKLDTVIGYAAISGITSTISIGGYGYIDNEIVRIDDINTVTKQITVGRGCLDTVPEAHLAGSKIYAVSGKASFDSLEYAAGETVNAKVRTRTSSNLLSDASAPADNLVMVGRFNRPYPPGDFRINSAQYPSLAMMSVTVSWTHRDRLLQLATIIDTLAGSIGPEPGTTYTVKTYRVSTGALLQSAAGLTGTSLVIGIPSGTYDIRVELESVVSGVTSFQKHSHVFTYSNPTARRVTEDGNPRITENLDSRHQE